MDRFRRYWVKECWEKSWNWAFRAQKKFVSSFKDETIKQLYSQTSSKHATIALFGKTQRGKTTLLLNLIGLTDEDYHAEVYSTLRGNRERGESATSVATIYKASVDRDKYQVKDVLTDNTILLTSTQMSEFIDKTRNEVESGSHKYLKAVEIGIPKRYFSDNNNGLDITVIDLPGFGGKSDAEREKVDALSRHYAQFAYPIILVEKFQHISQLDGFIVPGLGDWREMPDRYRIVISSIAGTETMQKRVKKKATVHLEDFKEVILTEIQRTIHNCPKEIAELVYPFDFGDSWQTLSKSNPEMKEKVYPALREARNKIISELSILAEPESRLLGLSSLHEKLPEIHNQQIKKLQKVKDEIQKEADIHSKAITVNEEIKIDAQMKLEVLDDKISTYDNLLKYLPSLDLYGFNPASNISNIGEGLHIYFQDLNKSVTKELDSVCDNYPEIDNSHINLSTDWEEIYSGFNDSLESETRSFGKSIGRGLSNLIKLKNPFSGDGEASSDLKRYSSYCAGKIYEIGLEYLKAEISGRAKVVIGGAQEKSRKYSGRRAECITTIQRHKSAKTIRMKKIDKYQVEINEKIKDYTRDVQWASTWNEHIAQEFDREISKTKERMQNLDRAYTPILFEYSHLVSMRLKKLKIGQQNG
jgi:hypothetical protein